jgi:hypothetical protein
VAGTSTLVCRQLLQLRVLRFSFLQDGDVGVFLRREKIFVGGERPNAGGIGVRALGGLACKAFARPTARCASALSSSYTNHTDDDEVVKLVEPARAQAYSTLTSPSAIIQPG